MVVWVWTSVIGDRREDYIGCYCVSPYPFHIKYNTTPPVAFLHQIVLRLLLSHHQANRKFLLFGISDKAITAHGIERAVTSLSVTLAVSLG